MKNRFLALVAKDLYHKKGHHLNRLAMVFPGKRARLFFNNELYETAGKPVWTPQYLSIKEVFALCKPRNAAGKVWTIGDPIYLNGLLYQEYMKIFKESEESFDAFYGWGKIILHDFDNIDKNLADAQGLFRLISETEALKDDFSHLNEEQVELLKSFFRQLNAEDDNKSEVKKNFVHLWNKMFALYSAFKQRLEQEAIVYEGMFLREIVEHWEQYKQASFPAEQYVFVGFNALNRCEEKFFLLLKEEGKALFYWDYDLYYTPTEDDHLPEDFQAEAGRFMRRNLKLFPNELKEHVFDDFTREKKSIEIVASPSENAQTHYAASHWLKQYHGSDTAIVLCNESLLLPMLHCLPQSIGDVNITMGYPLTQTPVYNLLLQIVLLHCDGCQRKTDEAGNCMACSYRSKFSLPILQNHYIGRICPKAKELAKQLQESRLFVQDEDFFRGDELMDCIFRGVNDVPQLGRLLLDVIRLLANAASELNTASATNAEPAAESLLASESLFANESQNMVDSLMPLYQESLFLCHQALTQLQDMLRQGLFQINFTTYRRLLTQVLNLSIPFSGEPLSGTQLMGLLETRNLDFENLLFLSANEGKLPQSAQDNSFIPYHIRLAYGLSMPQHQDAISAYYFMRMLQRAKHITLCYCNSTQGNKKGEMSRFLRQLLMESGMDIKTSGIGGQMKSSHTLPQISREGVVMPEHLSPSALKTFISCETKFYYERIAKLKAVEEVSEEMDALAVGNIFHHSMQYLYTELMLKKKGKSAERSEVLRIMADKAKKAHSVCLDVEVAKADVEAMMKNVSHLREVLELHTQMLYYNALDEYGKPLRKPMEKSDFNGNVLITLSSLLTFVKRTLACDAEYAPFRILDMEMPIASKGKIPVDETHAFDTNGIIDRLDYKDGVLRILDYKTGSKPSSYSITWERMFSEKASSFQQNALQTCLYAILMQDADTDLPPNIAALAHREDVGLRTALFYPQAALDKTYSPELQYSNPDKSKTAEFRRLHTEFRAALNRFLQTHYFQSDPEQSNREQSAPEQSAPEQSAKFFKRCDNDKTCNYCDFRHLCGR